MKNFATVLAAVGALVTPPLLIIAGSWRNGRTAWWSEPELLLSNWVYMLAPAALVTLLALPFSSARRRFLPQALIVLTLVLVLFQLWVWWLVPVRESGMAWVLYYPMSVAALLGLAIVKLVAHWWRRSHPGNP